VWNLGATALVAAFWALWHSLAQTYGFLRIYDAKAGSFEARTRHLDRAMCVAWFVGGAIFSAPRLSAILGFVYKSGGPLLSPEVVSGLRTFWMGGTAVVTLLFVAHWIDGWRRGKGQSPLKLLLLAISIVFWWFCMTSFANVIIGIALFEIFHDTQYLAIVWVYNGNRLTKNPDQWGFMRFAFRRSGVLLAIYVGLVLSYGYGSFAVAGMANETARNVLLGVVLASTLLHYYYDGFIWRVREKSTRETLGVKGAGGQDERELAPARVGLPSWARHGAYWSLFGLAVGGFAVAQVTADREELEWRQAIVEAVPESAIAQNNYGAALTDVGRADEALPYFLRATELDPQYVDANANVGHMLVEEGRADEAAMYFRRALRLEPDHVMARRGLARAFHAAGELDEAIDRYREFLADAPGDAETRGRLGSALVERGELEAGMRELQLALAKDPECAPALAGLARAAEESGRPAEAVQGWRALLARDPGDARAHFGLAQALLRSGQAEEAVGHYETGLAAEPDDVDMRWNLGLALQSLGRADDALAVFRRVVADDPGYAKGHNSIGLVLAGRGELGEAVRSYREAIELDPDYAVAHANLGLALQAGGDMRAGLAEVRRAVELEPEYAKGHYFLGLLLEASGAREEAAASLERALALDPALQGARDALAKLRS
jgi:tetratricopeptide (TPR) repeat protein